MQILLIGLFGAIGVLSRYFIDLQIGKETAFPASTFIINCAGSFLIGVLFVLGNQINFLSREMAAALTVGLIGGFTTFSAFSIQTVQLLEQKQIAFAALYFIGSPVLGVLFAFLGITLTKTLGTIA